MKHLIYILITLFLTTFFTACINATDKKSESTQADTIQEVAIWADEYITNYLESNKARLTEVGGYPISFIKEKVERNERNYAMVKIGHDFESRYVTDLLIFVDSLTKEVYEYDLANDSLILWSESFSVNNKINEIPPNGTYRFDIAFAEWEGKSMGEKVTVVIFNRSIKVIYEGDGQLMQTKKRDKINEGKIMKHKSGVWIIGKHPSDTQLDEIGGCTGGPAVIDFKDKKYWMC